MTILNLTQHAATAEQKEAGVVEPNDKAAVQAALTFEEPPTAEVMFDRARVLVDIARREGVDAAMIGGAPFFMGVLERWLAAEGIRPMYAFSRRESVDEVKDDGSVVKRSIFRHVAFVEAAV